MSGPDPLGTVPPNFRIPRMVGVFNVLFSAQILICGLCLGSYAALLPFLGRAFTQMQGQVERQFEAQRKRELAAIDEDARAATTEREKVEAAARRLEIQNRPKATLPASVDFTKMGMSDPGFVAWTWVEVLSGLVLNVALLVSGVGLLSWRPWARRLALGTAVLKVVRLVVLYSIFVLSLVPTLSQKIADTVIEMMATQGTIPPLPGGGSPAAWFARLYTVYYSGLGVAMIVGGVVYPVLVIWLLTRPSVKVACSDVYRLPKEPRQPC